MTVSPEQLEWIVQEVIRRLHGQPAQSEASELTLSDRVITLATLRDRLTNVGRIVVPSRAVVTPAVRDELNKRQIALVRQTKS
jgi:hypothetical protein